jgi:hypothetical protein
MGALGHAWEEWGTHGRNGARVGAMAYTLLDENSKRNRPNERVRLRCITLKFFLKRNRIRSCGLDSFEMERRKMGEFVKTTTKPVVSIKCGEFLEQLRNYQVSKTDYVLLR